MFLPPAKLLRRMLRARRRTNTAFPGRRRPLGVERLESRDVPAAWTQLASSMPSGSNGAEGMMLLSDGSVLLQSGSDAATNAWYRLTPDSSGNYVNGTISSTAYTTMGLQRLFFATNLLSSGKLFVLGGEYSGPNTTANWTNTGQIWDPVANTWTSIPNFPQTQFGDDPTVVLPNGNVLAGYLSGTATYIYNTTTNTWAPTGSKLHSDRSDEETWVVLPNNGGILSYDVFNSPASGAGTSQRYDVTTNTWKDAGSVPVPLTGSAYGFELGPGLLLPDGRVFLVGANGNTVLYTPSLNGGTGSWAAGPVTPNSKVADDAPGAILPNGHVLYAADTYISGSSNPDFNPPTQLFDFDPVANTITQQTSANTTIPANLSTDLNNKGSFLFRMLALPNGHILMSGSGSRLYDFAPDGSPNAAWAPTISNIAYNSGLTYTLTGTQLNGISEGASYGDDAEMSSNYPLVRLTNNSTGAVIYARTFSWSTTGVQLGSTPSTTQFTLPATLPVGTYTLNVVANGIASTGVTFTPPVYADTRWAGLATGAAITDVDPIVAGNQPGIVGTNAFASVNAAIAAAPVGGGVIVNGDNTGTFGKFNESVALTKQVTLSLQQGAVSFGSLSGNTANGSVVTTISLTVGGDNSSTEFDGVISGTGSLIKAGTGTFTVGGADTYTSGTTVSAGTFQIGAGGATGSIAGNVANNATLAFDRAGPFTYTGTIGGTGTTVNLGTATLTGIISGTESLNQNSTGQLTLSALNSFTGGVTVTAGTLRLGGSRGLGATSDSVQVNAGAALDLNGLSPIIGSLTLNGSLVNTGGGSPAVSLGGTSQYDLQLFSTSVFPAGLTFHFNGIFLGGLRLTADAPVSSLANVTLDFGSLAREISVDSGGRWNLIDVPINKGFSLTGGGTLGIQGATAAANSEATTVVNGTLDLGKTAGVNAVGGDVVLSGGTVHLSAGNQIPDTATITVNTGTFDLDGQAETIGTLTGTGGLVNLGGPATLTVAGSAAAMFPGTIAGPGGLVVTGGGDLTLSGTNTYGSIGGTTVTGGSTISVGADANLGDPAGPLVLGGGTLQAVGPLTTSRPVILNAAGGSIDTNGNAVSLPNPVAGAGGLTKLGAGTLTLGGTETYTGPSTVNAGILLVNGSLAAASTVTVAAGATLGGSGSVGPTTVNGTLSPGNGVGVLTTGSLTFTATGAFNVPLNGTVPGTDFSQVVANGPVDVTGATLVVPIGGGFTPTVGTAFDVLVNNSGSGVTGTFAGLPDGGTFSAGGQNFTISYHGGTSGNDVVLTKAPAAAPPTVTSVVVNDGSAQRSEVRSIAVTFSGPVTFANGSAAGAFQLSHVQDGNNVALTANVTTDVQNRTVVTLSFSGAETDSVSALNGGAASLADGRYTLTILGSNVTGAGGVALDGAGNGTVGSNYVSPTDTYQGPGLHLYRLYGDANGDGTVDTFDLGQFRTAYNSGAGQANYLAFLDADNSGGIDTQDLGQFRSRYNLNVF